MPVSPLRVLSLIPPMTQLNTPYPSTAYITGFLRQEGVVAEQADLAIELVLRLFSKTGLTRVHERALQLPKRERSAQVVHFLANFEAYSGSVDAVIRFLQGRDATLAYRICGGSFLPEGARFGALGEYLVGEDEDPLGWAFGSLGLQDRARHLATLYLNDLADVLRDAVDSRFEFVRYAESIAQSVPSFDPLARALAEPFNLIDETLQALTCEVLARHAPQVVLVSVPFPGSVYGAFRIAQAIKATHPDLPVVLGGGYVNTELRDLAEPRVFDYFDFVTLDDGERPLLALLEHLGGARLRERLVRTFVREAGRVRYVHFPEPDVPFDRVGAPTWDGLPIDRYLSVLDMLNPMHRLWSDGRWNKLTVAHGCYWKKCSFCDVSLDYISRYETANAAILVDRIEAIVAETGQSGFHFVDEAAPPKALRAMAEELLLRNLSITWWGNVRFEKSFTPELCGLLAASGCIAISGGLEVASDRLLKLMKKGVSVEQVARVTHAFSQAGILVHAYLMYGFPTQTEQDTVDALEYVRQLFAEGCIQSGFFHRFACTVHSPVGQHPEEYGIELVKHGRGSFGNNDVPFIDPTGVDHAMLGRAPSKAIYNFMHGIGLDQDVRQWFEECRVPRPQVSKRFIERALAARGTA